MWLFEDGFEPTRIGTLLVHVASFSRSHIVGRCISFVAEHEQTDIIRDDWHFGNAVSYSLLREVLSRRMVAYTTTVRETDIPYLC